MSSIAETVRQLAPHWGVMFVLMFGTLAIAEQFITSEFGFVPSLFLALVIVLAYPTVVRALGVAPPIWQRS